MKTPTSSVDTRPGKWYTDSSQTKTIVKHYSNKLRSLQFSFKLHQWLRNLCEKNWGAWTEDKKIIEFIENVTDEDYDTEMRVHDDSYINLFNAFRKRERDLETKVAED